MILQNAKIYRDGKWKGESLTIKGGRFVKASEGKGLPSVDLKGLMVLPGLVDSHAHFRDESLSFKETYESGSKAALAGGFTSCLIMANTQPPRDSALQVKIFKEKTHDGPLRLYPVGAVTTGLQGQQLVDFQCLLDEGCVAFSDDGQTLMNSRVLVEAFKWSEQLGFCLVLHEEDRHLSPSTGANYSITGLREGWNLSHEAAESSLVARDLMLMKEQAPGAHVHIAHVSSPSSLEVIHMAKEQWNLNLSWEVTPHHLFLDDSELATRKGFAKMSPPLRKESVRKWLWRAYIESADAICSTDHAPHTFDEKTQPFDHCPCGVVGLETALSVMWTLCDGDEGKLGAVVDSMSKRPAARFHIPGGEIRENGVADFIVFDPSPTWKVDPSLFYSLAKHSPFDGKTVRGRVLETWVGGQKVFQYEG